MGEKNTIYYNGMELECIDSGYWPDGVTMVYTADFENIGKMQDVACLRNGFAFGNTGARSLRWLYWAILLPKPGQRRLTNREVLALCRKGWDVCVCGTVSSTPEYSIHDERKEADDTMLRAPNTDEWVEPTTDLLDVGK